MIGYGRQSVDEDDVRAVAAVLRGDRLTCGPAVEAFEAALARAAGRRHAVAVASGTAALGLLYRALGVGPGARVGVPDVTFVATAAQAALLGAEVVLLDVDPDTGLLTPEILAAGDADLDWVVPVHLCGRLCDLDGLARVAAERGAGLVEDAAHALGSAGPGHPSPASRGAVHSFHPVKNVTTGEGGAVVTDDADLDRRLRALRHHGIARGGYIGPLAARDGGAPWYHEFQELAGNARLSDLHAALGLSQLTRLEDFKARRAAILAAYREALDGLDWIALPAAGDQEPCWHLCPALVEWEHLGMDRREFFAKAREQGYALQVHYIPLHCQPALAGAGDGRDFPGATAWYEREVSLPCFPDLAETDRERLCDWLRGLG